MTLLREYVATLWSRGVIGSGWYSIWTGVAMIYVTLLLGTASSDPAALFVAVVLAVTSVWCVERGYRLLHGSRRRA